LDGSVTIIEILFTFIVRIREPLIEEFHAPRFTLEDDGMHSSGKVQRAYALALMYASYLFALTKRLEQDARAMTDFLSSRTLATAPEQMFEIDRIAKACLSQVDLAWVPIADISWERMRNIATRPTSCPMTGSRA
jgi:hypothetical protein